MGSECQWSVTDYDKRHTQYEYVMEDRAKRGAQDLVPDMIYRANRKGSGCLQSLARCQYFIDTLSRIASCCESDLTYTPLRHHHGRVFRSREIQHCIV